MRGTDKKEIFRYSEANAKEAYFDELSESGCYAICNVSGGEYLYYNSAHKLIHSSSARLDKVASDFNSGVTVYSAESENGAAYYAFY